MAAGTLTEEVVEEVATNLEEVAEITRRLDPRALGFLFSGVGVGLAAGFYLGYRFNKQKLRAQAFAEAEVEIDAMREFYQQKAVASERKPELMEVVQELGYSERVDLPARPLPAPVPVQEPPSRSVPVLVEEEPVVEDWDVAIEMASRTPERPYVIHQNEFNSDDNGYEKTVYTYWAGDDVLTDTDNTIILDGDNIVGRGNLRWGHGADSADVVFVRNDRLQLDIEVCRDNRSYEEVVTGMKDPEDELRHSSQSRPAPRRRREE